jgi:hypothetical protein
MMRRSKNADLMIVIALAVAAGVVVLLDGPALLRSLLTLPLVFFLPGYALLAALFPADELETPARLLMGVALSLALVAVGGLVLHFSGLGLQSTSWLFVLVGISGAGCGVAWVRRRSLPVGLAGFHPVGLTPVQLLLVAGALGLAVAAVGIARSGVLAQPRAGFSELWMMPASSAPTRDPSVKIGVTNQEGMAVRYGLVILDQDDRVLTSWDVIDLGPGGHWQTTYALPSTIPPLERVEARLYRADAPDSVYRRVSLFPNASDQNGAGP